MGSTLGQNLSNAFRFLHERKWLEKCPLEFKPVFDKNRLIIFLFQSNQQIISKNFVATLIIFPLICPFHFVFIFDGVYTHSKSFLPSIHNFGMTRQFDK